MIQDETVRDNAIINYVTNHTYDQWGLNSINENNMYAGLQIRANWKSIFSFFQENRFTEIYTRG